MLEVVEVTKEYFRADSVYKEMVVTINKEEDGTVYTFNNDAIYYESFELSESMISGNKLSFVGCISSEMRVTVRATGAMKSTIFNGAKITAKIRGRKENNGTYTYSEWINLFSGYVDNGELNGDKSYIKLTCYDAIYKLDSINMWNWYRSVFKTYGTNKKLTLGDFRHYFFVELNKLIDLTAEGDELPTDDVIIRKRLKNKQMTALDLLKSICQLNCCCGMISRNGEVRFVYVGEASLKSADTYPSTVLPGNNTYPGTSMVPSGALENVSYYRELTHKDFYLTPFSDGITIRNNKNDNGITVSTSETVEIDWDDDSDDNYIIDDDDEDINTGNYIIEGNGLVVKLSKKKRKAIISLLLNRLAPLPYIFKDYTVKCNGLPYVECGDSVAFTSSDGTIHQFIVTNRKLTGIQAMVDTFATTLNNAEEEVVSADGITTTSDYSTSLAEQLSGDTVLIVKSFEDGVLTTTSKKIKIDEDEDE